MGFQIPGHQAPCMRVDSLDSLVRVCILGLALSCGVIARSQVVQVVSGTPAYDLTVVGDIMLGRLVGKELDARQASVWDKVGSAFPKAHLQIGNFEAAVAGEGLHCVRPGELCLTVAPKNLKALSQAGFTHMSLANNHAADLGEQGKEHSRTELQKQGIVPLDADWQIAFADAEGLRIAVVALSMVPDAMGRVAHIPSIAVAQKLALARALADKVVVVMHWGNELQPWASQQQRDAAHWLIGQGADMIFGHHPHVVQPAECIEGRPVWFSLGNHVFDQKYLPTHTGAMAACRFSRSSDDTSCDTYWTSRADDSAVIHSLTLDTANAPLTCTPTKRHEGRVDLNATPSGAEGTYDLFAATAGLSGKRVATALPLRKIMQMKLPSGQAALLMLLELESPFDKSVGLRPHVYAQANGQLQALWRGSALAYPIEDAGVVKDAAGHDAMCVLHEPVSHLGRVRIPGADHIVLAYRWTGFGFNVDPAPDLEQKCSTLYDQTRPAGG